MCVHVCMCCILWAYRYSTTSSYVHISVSVQVCFHCVVVVHLTLHMHCFELVVAFVCFVCVCVLSHMCCFLSVICTYGVEHLRLHICFCICVVGNVLFHGCRFVCVVAYVCLAAGIGERHGLGKMPTIISGKKRGRKRSAVNVLITLMHTNRC